jgi:hypothetical protein
MLRTITSGLIKSSVAIVTAFILSAGVARADVGCSETITAIIMHSNGNVYFTTSQTCSSWCMVSFSTADGNKAAYAMLLAAKAQDKPLWFDWYNLTSCSQQNAVYAAPGFMELN